MKTTTTENQKTKLVVIDGHTLGYILPGSNMAGILHASVLKGATFKLHDEPVLTAGKKIRLASEKDFNDFRVSFKGFDNTNEYEYKK